MLPLLLSLALLAQTPQETPPPEPQAAPAEAPAPPANPAPPPAAPTPYPPAPPPAAPTPYPQEQAAQAEIAPAAAPATPAPAGEEKAKSPMAGFVKDEGFRIKDESGNYVLRIGLQAALKFEPSWTGGVSNTRSAIGFLRPILRGSLFRPWFTYWVSLDLAGNPIYTLDAYFDVTPVEWFGVRVGQQYSPYDREEQLGPQQLFWPEFAPVADYFWPGRDKGIQAYGMLMQKRVEYYVGGFSGTPLRQTQTIPGNYFAVARLAFNPWGPTNVLEFPFTSDGGPLPMRFSVGVQGYTGNVESATENFNPDNGKLVTVRSGKRQKNTAGGGDLWFQKGPMIVTADVHYRHVDLLDGTPTYNQVGAWGQVIYNLWKNCIAAGAQFDWLDPDLDIDNDDLWIAEGELAWFIHAPDLVLKLRYAHVKQKQPTGPDVTLPYSAGDTNLLTVQFNFSF